MSTILEYDPSSEPLLITTKQLFLKREMFQQVRFDGDDANSDPSSDEAHEACLQMRRVY